MKLRTKHETRIPADIVAYAPDRHPVLTVEVRADTQATARDAADLRSRWLACGLVPDSAFFLLVYPTGLFLWRRETPAADPPDYFASTLPVIDNAKRSTAEPVEGYLRKDGLLYRVFFWLSVLVDDLRSADPSSEPEKMLIDSGVYARLRHGDIRFEGDL